MEMVTANLNIIQAIGIANLLTIHFIEYLSNHLSKMKYD